MRVDGPRIAFRADASAEIGIGHVQRCAVLANELIRAGATVELVCDLRASTAEAVARWVHPIHWIDRGPEQRDAELVDARATLSALDGAANATAWIVVDNERCGGEWEATLCDAGYRVLAIDDRRDRAHSAEVLLSEASAPFGPELNRFPRPVRHLLGLEFALIDPEFQACTRPTRGMVPHRLLVSYGGSDPSGETIKAIDALRRFCATGRSAGVMEVIDVVVGPANRRSREIHKAASGLAGARVHQAPSSLAPLMARADVMLCAGGNSLVEALACETPCIVTVTGENQQLLVNELIAAGAIRYLGRSAAVTADAVLVAIRDSVADYAPFSDRVRWSAGVDGGGAARVAALLTSADHPAQRPQLARVPR